MVAHLIFIKSDHVDIVFTTFTHSSTQPHKGPVPPSDRAIMEVIQTVLFRFELYKKFPQVKNRKVFSLFYGQNNYNGCTMQ